MQRLASPLLTRTVLLLVLLAPPVARAQDTSRDLLPRTVDQFGLGHPYLYYAVPARCATQFGGTPADYPASLRTGPIVNELEPVQIILRDNVTGARRLVWEYSPPRAPGQCNPYRVVSNISWDAQYLYWLDTGGLRRLPRSASAGDVATLVTNQVSGVTSADSRILDAGTSLYIYAAFSPDIGGIARHDKGSDSATFFDIVAPPARIDFDGRFVYYLNRTGSFPTRGTLRRWDSQVGQVVDIASDVTAFESVLYDLTCEPELGCNETSLILIATGRRVFSRDTVGPSFDIDAYVSAHPSAVVYDMALDWGSNRLYLFEERPPLSQPSFTNDQVLVRAPVSGSFGTPAVLLLRNGDPIDGLTAGVGLADVYWRHRFEGTIEVAAKDLAPLPQAELAITGMEVTQEVQDLANSVLLVAGKRTFVRVHARSMGGGAVAGIEAVLSGNRSGVSLGLIRPINPTGATLTLATNPQRQNVNQSFLFELPWEWVEAGPLRLDAEINADNRPIESNHADNTATRFLNLSESHTLVIQLVDFNWTLGMTNYTVSDTDVGNTSSFTQAIYPVAGVGGYVDQLRDSGLLLFSRRQIFDGDLRTRVDRSAPECGTDDLSTRNNDERNVCAANRTNARLREMKARGELDPRYFAYGLIPSDPANQALFPRGWAADGIGSGPSFDQEYLAHEVGHLLGRGHPVPASGSGTGGCGHSATDAGYPYPNTNLLPAGADPQTSFDGFDQRSGTPVANGRDIMGYCKPEWISDYTFEAMYDAIAGGASGGGSGGGGPAGAAEPEAAPAPGDWLIVIGDLDPTTGDATLQRVRRVIAANPALSDMGPYRLELRSLAGVLLDSWLFDATPIADAPSPRASFELVVPFAAGTRSLRIVEVASGDVLASQPVSANAPTVVFSTLAGAPQSSVVYVSFLAGDSDGDALRFDLLFSGDGGTTWRTLVGDASGSPIAVDTAELPGGQGRFRVQASDGVLTSHADSGPFDLASKPPRVQIVTPEDGTHVRYDQIVNLLGVARDVQDGAVAEADLVWSDDRGRFLGTGSRVTVDSLALGTRTITLTATNSLLLSASDSIQLVVEEQVGVPGPTLTVDPSEITVQVADGATAIQAASIAIASAGAGELAWHTSLDQGWIGIGTGTGTTPAVLGLSLDPSALADDTTHERYMTITSTSPPGQTASVLVRLVKGVPFNGSGPSDADLDTVIDGQDNCPYFATTNTVDNDGDGRGNPCECTDQNGDGMNTVSDLVAINAAIFNPGLAKPLCDGNGDGLCNVSDIVAANVEIFSPGNTSTCARQPVPGP